MAINFADRLFHHSFITIGNISSNNISPANASCNIPNINLFAYIATNQYLSDIFWKIMIDTSVSKHSTAGNGQFMAYTRDIKNMTIHITKGGAIHVQFRTGLILSIGSIIIWTLIGHIEFHIIKADTPFLFCFTDMDQLGIYFNNIDNSLVIKSTRIPIIRRFDQLFLPWQNCLNSFNTQSFDHNPCYLMETSLRQLHIHFEYPSVM